MTGRCKNKTRKPIETALGKAPKDTERIPDLSHLRKPIETSVFGLKQVISLFESATNEVQEYITYECDVLYECKICRTIFRSLANFILHKREYCREKYCLGGGTQGGGFVINEDTKASDDSRSPTPECKIDDASPMKKEAKKTILPIIDKLLKKQKIRILAKDTLNEDLSSKPQNDDDDVIFVSEENNVVLQKIDTSEAAVFQTAVKEGEKKEENGELMKAEIMEIHGILENNGAVLDSNGKVCTSETTKIISKPNIPKHDLVCTECNFTFSTEKTLTHHIKYKHNKTCIVYPCPDCKEILSNAWSVYRHLYKVHRRTTAQIRRMRDMIHSSSIRREQEPEKKKNKIEEKDDNEENQWMNNFEGDKDFQMCGGCGKRFERKAALHSHSQMCTKRIAVCNSIKNVKAKSDKKLIEKNEVKSLKGAAKRKPTFVSNYKGNDKEEKVTEEESEEKVLLPLPPLIGKPIFPENEHPGVEILTISDDSNESSEIEERQTQKRKRTSEELLEIQDEYKTYLNDEADQGFLARALPYMDKTNLKCISCESTFISIYLLLRHMSTHFSWYRFQCSKCSFMSFNKYDCTTHAYNNHSVPNNLIENTVLPIPKWKVLCASHDFTEEISGLEGDNIEPFNAMPVLEAVEEKSEENEELIVLEDDEMPDLTDPLVLSDEEKSEGKGQKAAPSTFVNERPVRNRQRSVKTLQDDFIYDLTKVLKLNDNSSKRKKVKKIL